MYFNVIIANKKNRIKMIIINDTITTNNSNDDDDADDLEVAHPHSRSSSNISGRIGIWKSWFSRAGEKWSNRRKTSRSKGENQQQTQPKYDMS